MSLPSMTNLTLVGNCVAPFLDASRFPSNEGFIPGRFCERIADLPGQPTCCLPCPASAYTYPQTFESSVQAVSWLNVVGLAMMAFLLVSYRVLPAQITRSHYLSICLIVSIMMVAIGFTIPLASKPEQCYNEITPNGMYSSLECAFSGAFVIAGGLSVVMWVFIRALSMNLQICWDIIPGKRFFLLSQLLGWGIPALLFTLTMTLTGVSFRLGDTCHVNHEHSMTTFWGPLLFIAGTAGILQVATFAYCINVYLKNLWTEQGNISSTNSSSGLPTHNGSVRAQTAKAVYQRLKKVLWLQWRGIFIVTIILVDVIYFSIIFVSLDHMQATIGDDWLQVGKWVLCLVENPNNVDQCLPLVDGWLVSEPIVISVLALLSVAGIQCFLLLARPSLFTAWWELLTKGPSRHQDFINLDAAPTGLQSRDSKHQVVHEHGQRSYTFEMQAKKSAQVTTTDITDDRPVSAITIIGDSQKALLRTSHRQTDSYATTGSHHGNSSPHQSIRSPPMGSTLQTQGLGTRSPPAAQLAYGQSAAVSSNGDYFGNAAVSPIDQMASSSPASHRSQAADAEKAGRGGLGFNPPSESSGSPRDEYAPHSRR